VVGLARWLIAKAAKGVRESKARNWPARPAVIDVVSVVEQALGAKDRQDNRFEGTLTYFYRTPELQMGEYQRLFKTREEARGWVNQFKNRTVMVHVSPEDQGNSVLLKSDLAGLDLHVPLAVFSPAKVVELEDEEMEHAISPSYRLVCGLAELASLSGLAVSGVFLAVSVATHERTHIVAYWWLGGALLACSIGSALAVFLHLKRNEAGRWLLKSYKRWCPGWMRWGMNLTALLAPFSHVLSPLLRYLPGPWMNAIAPYLPFILGGWIFFMNAAFHSALLRSQEEVRVPLVGA
jgi:hypothetical protein